MRGITNPFRKTGADASKSGIKKYDDGDVYEGELKNGDRHGQGKMRYADGGVYEGEWVDDWRHGKGKMKYADADGEVYEGEWKDDARHGQGKLSNTDCYVCEGGWKDDEMHGKGKFTWADGDYYEGEFEEGSRHGTGTYTSSAGWVYDGEWKDGDMHGEGRYTYASGAYYEGGWKDDKKHGKGKFTSAERDVWEGSWYHDRRHGEFTVTCRRILSDDFKYKDVYRYGKLLPKYPDAPIENGTLTLTLGEEDITCGICNAEYSSNLSEDDENIRRHLPVLGSCGHHCCHGCALEVQAAQARRNGGRVPKRIQCMHCRKKGAFCPGEPTYFRVLADFIERSTTYARRSCLCGMMENASLSDL